MPTRCIALAGAPLAGLVQADLLPRAARAWTALRLGVLATLSGLAADGTTAAAMKRLPAGDALFGRSILRGDGEVSPPMHLFRVKAPAES